MRAMFAVVRTGGKQYRVAAGDKIVVDKIDGDAGARVSPDGSHVAWVGFATALNAAIWHLN